MAKSNSSTETKYQASVYHGGTMLGYGLWRKGKQWATKEAAEREGRRMAYEAKVACGGSPEIEIVEINV